MQKNLDQSLKECIEIDPYINVEEEKDKQGRVLFRFIRFNLNRKLLAKILRSQAIGKRLQISQTRKAQLRYCVLSDGENWHKEGRFQSGLTFCTYYEAESKVAQSSVETIVMRSVISLDGDIIHQVRRDCLDEPEIGLAIAQAHHWILEQLLNQLSIRITLPKSWVNRLAWGLSLLIVLVATVILLVVNVIPVPLIFVVVAVICVLLQQLFKRLLPSLTPEFRRLVGHQLLLRLLSPNPKGKKIARLILERF